VRFVVERNDAIGTSLQVPTFPLLKQLPISIDAGLLAARVARNKSLASVTLFRSNSSTLQQPHHPSRPHILVGRVCAAQRQARKETEAVARTFLLLCRALRDLAAVAAPDRAARRNKPWQGPKRRTEQRPMLVTPLPSR
jgi:hypothetical protein